MVKKDKKSNGQEQEQITHPTMSVQDLIKNGTRVSVKPKSYAKDRIVKLLVQNNENGLTQGMISQITGMREQHINNIVRTMEESGDIERYMVKTQVNGKLKELIYNVFVGDENNYNLE